jgi:hypothetical protein
MTQSFFNLNVAVSALLLSVLLFGCSGDRQNNNSEFAVKPVAAVASVRTVHEANALLEEATGVSRSTPAVQSLLSDRGNSLSWTGGKAMSGPMLQALMDLAATYCVQAGANASNSIPQKVFLASTRLNVAPSVANFPDSVIIPQATHLLQQFSGEKPTEAEIQSLASSMRGFLQQQRTDNNNGSGTRRAMEAACVTAAVSINSALSR